MELNLFPATLSKTHMHSILAGLSWPYPFTGLGMTVSESCVP